MVAAALAEVAKTKAVLPAHTDFTVICPGLCLGRTSKDAKKGVTHAPAAKELPSSSAGLAKAQDPPRTESALQVVSQTSRPSPRLSSCRVGAVAPMPSLKEQPCLDAPLWHAEKRIHVQFHRRACFTMQLLSVQESHAPESQLSSSPQLEELRAERDLDQDELDPGLQSTLSGSAGTVCPSCIGLQPSAELQP